jgi:ferredoxin--NADP+ reductase
MSTATGTPNPTATAAHGAPALRDAQMHVYRPTDPVTVTISRNDLATFKKSASVVRHVEMDVSGTKLEKMCQPGQAIGVLPDGVDKTGKPHKLRLYSLSHPTRGEDGKGRVIAVTVKRTIDEHWDNHTLFVGVASNWLCDGQVGEKIRVSGPNGKKFLLPKDPSKHDYIFVATGTGIAPFRGMIIDLLEAKVKSKIVLIMGVPYSTDLLYHDFLLKMAQENPNFTYITAISREKQEGHDRLYVQDRFRTERDRLLPVLADDRTLIYMCGLAGMELGIFQELALNLNGSALEQYLQVDHEALRDIRRWNRQMIHKQVRPTHRVLMEVYA